MRAISSIVLARFRICSPDIRSVAWLRYDHFVLHSTIITTSMILVLHGALGSRHQFESLMERLGERGSFMKFTGHGTTTDDGHAWTIPLFVEQLERYLEAGAGDPVTVFGYSMGGYVAMTLALRRPELFRNIVTLGTKLAWTREGAEKEAGRLNADIIAEKVPAFAADLQRRHGVDRWQSVLDRTAGLMRDLGAMPLLTQDGMASMSVPVRFMLGDRDEMVGLDETVAFYKATPGAEFAVLPTTRHPIEKVNLRYVLQHLDDIA